MKYIIKSLPYLLYFAGALLIIAPFIFWFRNPESTEMQMFKEYWYLYFVAIIFILMGNLSINQK